MNQYEFFKKICVNEDGILCGLEQIIISLAELKECIETSQSNCEKCCTKIEIDDCIVIQPEPEPTPTPCIGNKKVIHQIHKPTPTPTINRIRVQIKSLS